MANFTSLEKLMTKEDKNFWEWALCILVYTIGGIWIALLVFPFMLLIVIVALPLGIIDWFKRKDTNVNTNNKIGYSRE